MPFGTYAGEISNVAAQAELAGDQTILIIQAILEIIALSFEVFLTASPDLLCEGIVL